MQTIGLVLAAGQGTRMKSKMSKVMHPLCGKPMIGHVVSALEEAGTNRNLLIVGRDADSVQDYIGDRAEYVVQAEQLGTAHAVMQAEDQLRDESGDIIIVCGDMPLIRTSSLVELIKEHQSNGATGTILTAQTVNPYGYGRIIRNADGEVTGIVEESDCTAEQALIQEINAGAYCFDIRKLFAALNKVTMSNAQQEYYLTDVLRILREQGDLIQTSSLDDFDESIGINDRAALAKAEHVMRQRINASHMANGVTLIDPANTYIDTDVTIGIDSIIYPGTIISGKTVIGSDCVIGPQCDIADATIGDGVEIRQSVLRQATVGSHSTIGPFAHLRPGANIREKVRIGNYVEIKNAEVGAESTIAHLSYVGDASVGQRVNIGCGAITVNYDGFHKHQTVIGDDAFIGSNVNLIAPLMVGKEAMIVAGSTITEDVPPNGVAIARSRQTNKPNYAEKLRSRLKQSGQKK